MDYTLIRSERKTVSVSVKGNGSVVVRAPKGASRERIEGFLLAHKEWIEKTREKVMRENAEVKPLKKEELSALCEKAKKVIPEKVRRFAGLLGVTYGRITIRTQKTRWGSCSANGNLSFNALLMLMPDEVTDSVVVHELCHRREMNHSAAFYELLTAAYPGYYECRAYLKKHGSAIIKRLGG